jgi:hypothetical protein
VLFRRTLAVLLLLTTAAFAQSSRVAATLEGTVTDATGAAVVGARVTLRNNATGQGRELTTSSTGGFLAAELPVGTYEVRVEAAGFATYQHAGVVLMVGQTARLEVQLAPASVQQQVTVSAQPSALDPTQATVTASVDVEKIEELPVRSRNFLNFVLLAPGVASSNQQAVASAQSQLPDSGFTFGGLRARSNNLNIDGLENNDEYTGASRTELSLEIVREFQVVNNGLSAESGGASGGSINVVTKAGANLIHGDAFLFAQNNALNARQPLTDGPTKPDFNRYRAGFAIGGPIRKDRTFYYAAVEQEHNRGQAGPDIDPAAAGAINSALASGVSPLLPTREITTGFFPISRAETEASGKLNHQLTPNHSLLLRYSFTNNREAGDAFNTGGFTDASARGSSFIADHALVGALTSVFGGTAVNEGRFQVSTRRVALRTGDQTGPGIQIPGVISFGRPYEGNSFRRENHYDAGDTFSLARGRHLLKAGGTVNRVRERLDAPDGFGGVYLFASVPDFVSGNAAYFRQAFGDVRTDFAVTAYGAFVQDHWSVGRGLTLDLGVRYDYERLPSLFNQDTNNFSPRVGLAYSPSAHWVVRAGYGVYFDRYALASLHRAVQGEGERVVEKIADNSFNFAATVFAFTGGGPLQVNPFSIRPSVFTADRDLATPYSQQANLGVERLLSKNLTASVNYLFVRGVKLPRTVNANLSPAGFVFTPTWAAALGIANPAPQQLGRVFFPDDVFAVLDSVTTLQDRASSTYHGLMLALNRRLANEVEFSANYTLSKTLDDASDFDEQPQNPFDLRAERSLSRNDQRHRFVFSALFDLPFGQIENGKKPKGALPAILGNIEVAPILTIASGRPVNPLTSLDFNFNRAWPLSSRPLGRARNSLRTPGFAALDLRVLKFIPVKRGRGKLDLVAEFFNLFNRLNVSDINPFFGTGSAPAASFARPLEAQNPRQMQFSIDFEF